MPHRGRRALLAYMALPGLALALVTTSRALAQDPLAAPMAKLSPFIGRWRAEITLYPRNAPVERNVGIYEVTSVLGGGYLQWNAARGQTSDGLRPSFMLLTTYDARERRYVQTYFYPGTAFQVVERGEFDEAAREFRTTAHLQGGAGGRDYFVRSVTKIMDDGTLEYRNWGRYDGDETEVLDMEARLIRMSSLM